MKQFTIAWHDSGKEPTCAPNPNYPDGIDLDLLNDPRSPEGQTGCKVMLPYPAKRIGHYEVICTLCNSRVRLTTAGRRDDPRSVTIPCSPIGPKN